ncbi:unnamed protein product [Caenorhabditis bovis]|uniref:DUF4440 domain-containing protein n=1 Tax=Caenorhabditis bovis TaxID=2654633 RepID=A0A8S1F6Q2_9PELO|nr:unnamed protein product [Caenorhabditis bovis]
MSVSEFQKIIDDMQSLKKAMNTGELIKKYAATGSTFLAPLHEPLSGADLAKFYGGDKAKFFASADVNEKVDEATQLGDVAIVRSTLIVKAKDGDKHGWTLTVWVKEGGQWKVRNSCITFKAPK